MSLTQILGDLFENFIATVVMLIVGILAFFVTVFVISTGAQLAGYTGQMAPSGDFVVLSATILVASTILSGLMK